MNVQATGQTFTLPRPALTDLSMLRSKRIVVGFWIATAFFCLQMGFTAYAQLSLPQVAEMFTHLGFPDFAITLASALVAHFAVSDGPQVWSWAAATSVLWGLSYFLWRRMQATPAKA
jgi:hypothetical protein